MTEQEKHAEREQVEYVFGLTGGELSATPWAIVYEAESSVDGKPFTPEGERVPEHEVHRSTWRYWYDDAPEYAARECAVEFPATTRTVVTCALYGGVRRAFYDANGKRWELLKFFTNSGETECPRKDETIPEGAHCDLCDGTTSAKHGFIYLGDGWVEAVYVCSDFWEEDE